jgi:hypothetical protein
MNGYAAEIFAAERSAAFQREAASARLIREARRGTAGERAVGSARTSRLVAAVAFALVLWMAVAP